MAGSVGSFIGVYYALVTLLISSWSIHDAELVLPGIILFAVGTLGNFYYHVLLRQLRCSDTEKYVEPTGGLFDYVAAPHYLFELLAWWGVALVAQHWNAALAVTSMTVYLGRRAMQTNEFYKTKFDDWNRKALIPFVF